MRKWLIVLIGLICIGVIVACSNEKVGETKEKDTNKQEDKTEVQVNEQETEEMADFRNVDITYEKDTDTIKLKGEAIATNAQIYYKVEQLGEEIIMEKEIELDSERKWEEIEFSLAVSELTDEEEAAIFILYTKDKTGEPVKPNHHFPVNLIQMREY